MEKACLQLAMMKTMERMVQKHVVRWHQWLWETTGYMPRQEMLRSVQKRGDPVGAAKAWHWGNPDLVGACDTQTTVGELGKCSGAVAIKHLIVEKTMEKSGALGSTTDHKIRFSYNHFFSEGGTPSIPTP